MKHCFMGKLLTNHVAEALLMMIFPDETATVLHTGCNTEHSDSLEVCSRSLSSTESTGGLAFDFHKDPRFSGHSQEIVPQDSPTLAQAIPEFLD